jgi:hypothetical protein
MYKSVLQWLYICQFVIGAKELLKKHENIRTQPKCEIRNLNRAWFASQFSNSEFTNVSQSKQHKVAAQQKNLVFLEIQAKDDEQ